MDLVRRVRQEPELPWLTLGHLTRAAVRESLDFWVEEALERNSVESITSRVGCVVVVSLE